MSLMLTAESIRKTYPTRSGVLTVLSDVNLSLEAGQSASIMGPSGSGKSTLLNILGALDVPTGGRLSVDGVNPFDLGPQDMARFRNRSVGFVFQDHHLLAQCSAIENVLLPTIAFSDGGGALDRARSLLDRVGLADRLDHRPAELSGGERQRVAIARAMINQPRLVLADEPTGNLDRAAAEAAADLLVELHREQKSVLVVVTHSDTLARRFDRRFELLDGCLAERE